MQLIKNYPEGSDITLIDTVYRKPKKDDNTGKWTNSSMTIVYKDNNTGLKHHEVIERPTYEFYVANDDVYIPHHMFFIEKEKTHPVVCECNKVEKTIAEVTGMQDLFRDNIANGNSGANRLMHHHPRVFMSDTHPEDYYRFQFARQYTNNITNIKKAFFDIEVDGINMVGDFPKYDDSPINAVCLINLANNQVYSYLLRNPNNKSMIDFEKNLGEETFNKLKQVIIDKVGGHKNFCRYGLDKLEYNVMFYDEEIALIHDLFIGINTLEPDFLLAWNIAFDLPFIIDRIKYLGYDPADIICHPDFDFKEVFYYMDDRNYDKPEERGDFARISANTIYMDQLILFASRRKGQDKFKSHKLDDIGKAIAGIGKVDYHSIVNNLVDLPYKDYTTFWIYNVLDVIVQVCIEHKTNDVDYVYGKCIANNTRYSKAHRQTVYLANRAIKSFYNMGYILGNNINNTNPKPETKFKGAYVADPALTDDYSKIKLNGHPINLYDNLDDFDYARLYPSVLQEFNMAPNTQKGKLIIEEQIHDKENKFGETKYNRGGAYIEDIQSQNYLEFGSRWLHLATYSELIEDINEFFTTEMAPNNSLVFTDEGLIDPIIKSTGLRIPIYKSDDLKNPIIKFQKRNFDMTNNYFDGRR